MAPKLTEGCRNCLGTLCSLLSVALDQLARPRGCSWMQDKDALGQGQGQRCSRMQHHGNPNAQQTPALNAQPEIHTFLLFSKQGITASTQSPHIPPLPQPTEPGWVGAGSNPWRGGGRGIAGRRPLCCPPWGRGGDSQLCPWLSGGERAAASRWGRRGQDPPEPAGNAAPVGCGWGGSGRGGMRAVPPPAAPAPCSPPLLLPLFHLLLLLSLLSRTTRGSRRRPGPIRCSAPAPLRSAVPMRGGPASTPRPWPGSR